MRTDPAEVISSGTGFRIYGAATDPIEPIHEYNIPILPFKHPPSREDFNQIRKRHKHPDTPEDKTQVPPQVEDGHVDDYA